MKPNMDDRYKNVRYLLYLFNAVFMACGLGLLIPAIIDYYNVRALISLKEEIFIDVYLPIIKLIILSVFIIISVVVGFFAAFKKNYYFTATYIVFLVIIFISLIIVGSFHFLDSTDDTKEKALDLYKKDFRSYVTNEKFRTAVDNFQEYLGCCGLDGKEDFEILFNNKTVPVSCCPRGRMYVNELNCTARRDIFERGCSISFVEFLRLDALRIITFGITAVMFVGIFLGLFFMYSLVHKRYYAEKI